MLSLNLSDDKYLSNVRSAECLQLDLNSKISKKKQIKLLNAKLKQLKQKCKILRQQSKTQRQMLSNLMNQTSTLQQKTNSGIQACKQVCTQMLHNHNKFNILHSQPIIIQTINNVIQKNNSVAELILESNCSLSMSSFQNQKKIQYPAQNLQNINQNIQTSHQIIQKLVIKNQKVKKHVYQAPTSRSFTSSLKQQQSKRSNLLVINQANVYQTSTLPSEDGFLAYGKDRIPQCLTNKMKGGYQKTSRMSKDCQISSYKNMSRQTQIKLKQNQKIHNKIKISSRNQNIFINYFYAITAVIIITIILKITLL